MAKDLFNLRDIIAYFFVAGVGFLIQLLAGSLLQDWFALDYTQALFIGYGAAFLSGFILTKLFAFNARNSAQTRREGIKFVLVSIISCFITVYGASYLFSLSKSLFGEIQTTIPYAVKTVYVNQLVAQVIAMGASFTSNYILHKKFTFANTGFYDRLKKLLKI